MLLTSLAACACGSCSSRRRPRTPGRLPPLWSVVTFCSAWSTSLTQITVSLVKAGFTADCCVAAACGCACEAGAPVETAANAARESTKFWSFIGIVLVSARRSVLERLASGEIVNDGGLAVKRNDATRAALKATALHLNLEGARAR